VVGALLVSVGNADVANANADRILLSVPQLDEFHNGGQVAFGLDDYLYVGLGDGNGATGGDPAGTAQDTSDLLGSLLRLDVSGPDGLRDPARQSLRRRGGRAARAVGPGPAQSVALQLRSRERRPVHRRRRPGLHEEIDVASAASGGGRGDNYGGT
jgi:hypothetical protein